MRGLVAAVAISLAALGCARSQEDLANGDDPLAALESTVRSTRYGEKYWQQERDAQSSIWTQALEYCRPPERANYPNCEVVRQVDFLSTPTAPGNPAQSEKGLSF